MRPPSWVPEVRCPWNPAYRETWAAMSREERQWSFLVDLLIALPPLVLVVWSMHR